MPLASAIQPRIRGPHDLTPERRQALISHDSYMVSGRHDWEQTTGVLVITIPDSGRTASTAGSVTRSRSGRRLRSPPPRRPGGERQLVALVFPPRRLARRFALPPVLRTRHRLPEPPGLGPGASRGTTQPGGRLRCRALRLRCGGTPLAPTGRGPPVPSILR